MPDLTYLNRDNILEEARYFFESDFLEISKDFTINKGKKEYGNTYKQYFDAYRHTYGSAVLTREFGSLVANNLGKINEFDFFGFRKSDPKDKNQDLWNNAVGREFGLDNPTGRTIADRIKNAFNSNLVIVDRDNDLRKYEGNTKLYTLASTGPLQNFLTKYNLNPKLEDYSHLIPSFTTHDSEGNLFNMSAFPSFDDLFGDDKTIAQENFLNDFLGSSLMLHSDLDDFINHLNSSKISFEDFSSDINKTFNINDNLYNTGTGTVFLNTLGSIMADNFSKEFGLNHNLFSITTTLTSGENIKTAAPLSSGTGIRNDHLNDSFDNHIITENPSLILDADDKLSMNDLKDILWEDGYYEANEENNYAIEEYQNLINSYNEQFQDLQESFIANFNQDFIIFREENIYDWEESFFAFKERYDKEWERKFDDLFSWFEGDIDSLIEDLGNGKYYNPDNISFEN